MKRNVIALVLGALVAAPVAAQQVTFMTGPQGGVWVPLAARSRVCGRKPSRAWDERHRDAGRWHRQRSPRRRGEGTHRLRQFQFDCRWHRRSRALQEESHQRLPVADKYPQYFQVVAVSSANVKWFAI